jgi:bifunctional non-homologous end joining protein LigD
VKLYTITGADWSKRYPLISESAGRIQGSAILDAEVVWLDSDGVTQFDALHSRINDRAAIALAFDILMHNGEDVRRKPFAERKAILRTRRGIALTGGPSFKLSLWHDTMIAPEVS